MGRLVTRATNDIQNMHEMFTSVVTFIFNDLFLIVGIVVVMMLLSWKLTLACLMVIPLVALAATYFATAARGPYRRMRVKIAEINSTPAPSGIRPTPARIPRMSAVDNPASAPQHAQTIACNRD